MTDRKFRLIIYIDTNDGINTNTYFDSAEDMLTADRNVSTLLEFMKRDNVISKYAIIQEELIDDMWEYYEN